MISDCLCLIFDKISSRFLYGLLVKSMNEQDQCNCKLSRQRKSIAASITSETYPLNGRHREHSIAHSAGTHTTLQVFKRFLNLICISALFYTYIYIGESLCKRSHPLLIHSSIGICVRSLNLTAQKLIIVANYFGVCM